MTDTMNTTAREAGAIILSRHDANRLEAGLTHLHDALGGIMDADPDRNTRASLGTLGLAVGTAGELLGIIDGWNRRGPEPVAPITPKAGKDAPAGNVSPDCRKALVQVEDARSEAQDVEKLLQAAFEADSLDDVIASTLLLQAQDKARDLVMALGKASDTLTPHAEADQTGGPDHA